MEVSDLHVSGHILWQTFHFNLTASSLHSITTLKLKTTCYADKEYSYLNVVDLGSRDTRSIRTY